MADSSRLIHHLPLPHLVVGAAVIVGGDTAVEEDVAVALQNLILEGEGTEAGVAEVEIDSLSLRRLVEKGDINPNRMVAGMTTAVQEEAAAVVDMVVIADVVCHFVPALKCLSFPSLIKSSDLINFVHTLELMR